jgi:hypothetical protein
MNVVYIGTDTPTFSIASHQESENVLQKLLL